VALVQAGVVSMDREIELNLWREGGKKVGRKLGVIQERKRIIAILEEERDSWVKPASFSYKNALTDLIERISVKFWVDDKSGRPLNRFEALDLLYEVNKLVNEQKFGAAMQLIGMDDAAFAPEQTMDEMLQVFMVRFADLARQAGIDLKGMK